MRSWVARAGATSVDPNLTETGGADSGTMVSP
jgi:hypothetical protein